MSAQTESPLATIESSIRGVRRSIARWFIVDGLVRLIAAVLVICAIDFGIDYFFQMDRAQRTIMLVLISGAVLWVAWKWLWRPLRAPITDEAICFEVGQQNPAVGERILTSLEFSRTDWSGQAVSRLLVESAVADGGQAVEPSAFSGILRRGRFATNALLLIVLLVLLGMGIAGTFNHPLLSIWANRNLMLGDASWPADFQLEVDGLKDGRIVIPRGDTWPLTVRVADGYKALPEEVQIEFRTDNSGTRRETMNTGGNAGNKDGRTFVYRVSNVVEPFRFKLQSGRVSTDWIDVELIDRPVIDSLSLTATPPEYTGRGEETLPTGSDTYFLLRGTSVEIAGNASKQLKSAKLMIGETEKLLEVDGDRFRMSLPAGEAEPGTWQLQLVDQESVFQPGVGVAGLGTRDPVIFNVRRLADKAPSVKADLVGIGSLVLPSARLPFETRIEDDYRVTKIELEYAWRQEQSEDQTENVDTMVPQAATSENGLGTAEAKLADALDLQPLNIPPASRLRVRIRAEDNDTVSGPNIGESTDLLVRVVTEPELRNQFLLRERQQRQVFEDIAKRQDTLMTDCEAFLADTRPTESINTDKRSDLFKLQRRQKLISANIKPVIESLDAIVLEAVNNRLPDEQDVLKSRLQERIINPMRKLREELIPGATVPLDGARTQLDARVARNASLESTLAGQRAILASMNEILVHMVKNERFQLAIIRLYEIQRLQNELKKQTDAEKEAELKKLLEENE